MRALPLLLALPVMAQAPADHAAEIAAWHKGRIERLKSENGWLTLVGLDWLSEGENLVGSAEDAAVAFPRELSPAHAAVLVLEGRQVRLMPVAGSPLTVNGQPAVAQVLKADVDGTPDVMKLGGRSFYIIRRGEKVGVRVKDPLSPVRTAFKGIDTYPADAAYRVVGTWNPYPQPKEVMIPTVLGVAEPMKAWGTVTFTLKGKTFTLQPVDEGDGKLFFVFKDATSGHGTYPAGRFVYAEPPKDGKVILDFNKAYNPPCAFTPFATCPLPPKSNVMDVAIEAGEKSDGHP